MDLDGSGTQASTRVAASREGEADSEAKERETKSVVFEAFYDMRVAESECTIRTDRTGDGHLTEMCVGTGEGAC